MSEKQHCGSGMKDNTDVIIKPKAYMKNEEGCSPISSNVEGHAAEFPGREMGMLMGRLVDGKNPDIKDVIIEDAVPVEPWRGGRIGFAPEDYVNFRYFRFAICRTGCV